MMKTNEIWLVFFGVLVAILLRCCTSLHPYSGQGAPPMYGDYEAQRHWMEITVNLPVREWYKNSSDNNLEYWGLDYPPLTAYHMYLCGLVAGYINKNYTLFHDSRGFESDEHKLFMRYTVLIVDVLLYIPSLVIFYLTTRHVFEDVEDQVNNGKTEILSTSLSIILALLYPGIILIDHGHFQYNCVSLGFLIAAVTCILNKKDIYGSFLFCLAVNYKQMELYHAIPFFVYLLSTCVPKPGQKIADGFLHFVKIATTVLLTFLIIWWPYLHEMRDLVQVLHRQFPFARGVFEDKVANFWCTVNIFVKLKNFTINHLMHICLLTTLCAVFPTSVDIFLRPSRKKFILSLINASLAFFLFSYQVHEKTILVVAIPVLLYSPVEPFVCFWFLSISTFSMLPLFIKDKLLAAYFPLMTFHTVSFFVSIDHFYKKLLNNPDGLKEYYRNLLGMLLDVEYNKSTYWDIAKMTYEKIKENHESIILFCFHTLMLISKAVSLILTGLAIAVEPPERYPDLFPLLISTFCCVHFMGFYAYFNIKQLMLPQEYEEIREIKHAKLKTD